MPEDVAQRSKVRWQWGLNSQTTSRNGMGDFQDMGMEGLPVEAYRKGSPALRAVDWLTEDRMTDFREVDPDLMSPARLQPASDLRGHFTPSLDGFVVGDGCRTTRLSACYSAPAVAPVGYDRHINRTLSRLDHSFDHRDVASTHGVCSERGLQRT
jgi:hypothetical protein